MHIQFICEHISSIDMYHCGSRWWDVMAGLTYAADLINGVWVFEWDKWDWESEREHKYGGSSKSKCDVRCRLSMKEATTTHIVSRKLQARQSNLNYCILLNYHDLQCCAWLLLWSKCAVSIGDLIVGKYHFAHRIVVDEACFECVCVFVCL